MKKLVAIAVLLASLTAAVFAQEEESKWKVGFGAQLARNIFHATKTTGKSTVTQDGQPDETTKLGDYIKGTSNFWTWTDNFPRPDNRLIVSLSHNGDHHSAYVDFKLDDGAWIDGWNFMKLVNGDNADWYFTGDTGALGSALVVDGKVGTGRYGGYVPVYEFWNDYIQEGGQNFFGVHTIDGFMQSNNIAAVGMNDGSAVWDPIYALGLTFGNFRFATGAPLASFQSGVANPFASASFIESGFMISGRPTDAISFDLFYAVKGSDKNTVVRGTHVVDPATGRVTFTGGTWDNLLGAYVGLSMIDNLGLSLGYTASFKVSEKAEQLDGDAYKAYDVANPIWSGVDIKFKYSGINKMGITFNNNLSFSGAKGAERTNAGDKWINGLDGVLLGKDIKQGWFAWTARGGVSYSLTDNLSLGLAFRNVLTVFTEENEDAKSKDQTTGNEFVGAIHADYHVGAVSFGLGLQLGLEGAAINNKSEHRTVKGNQTTAIFAVPVFFKVAF